MPYRLKSSELSRMTTQEQREALGGLVDAARHDSAATRVVLEGRIREYEQRYGIDSDDVPARLADGRLQDTAEVSQWLILLRALRRYEQP